MADTQTSINIPQILAVAIVGFFAIRWFLNKPVSDSPTAPTSSSRRGGRAVDINKINQVTAMFPQLDRRTIAWDLQRNGGSVPATTERVLSGRALETPPPSFQPNIPSAATEAGSSTGAAKRSSPSQPDLITRYNLQGRIGGKGKEAVPSVEQEQEAKKSAWSADKAARAENLKRRREEMILAARRKMEAQEGQA
ncbi:uncharacterized protein LTR77_007795 [Saxophila tyrrhenica]|uniref:Coupling of ubiquitin conjugation to ER degradation protein 1 n=1 Tax=Saxophila tyrrhenica TaxID=1690608 RepID=A0AAV9P5X6_9PEZI|nr:hypothetical protein LTR77_007795 [Saxophila tyrrhenica]